MQHQLAEAIKHWEYIASIVKYPKTDKEFNKLVKQLDELLDIVGNDENHRLMSLIDVISTLITVYEQENIQIPKAKGVDALKFLMEAHHLNQSDLPEIASQGVISEILHGKRELNLRQIKLLAKRFHVNPATFLND
jgi:HTH-type transcriptional regulator / antitoxin HigA